MLTESRANYWKIFGFILTVLLLAYLISRLGPSLSVSTILIIGSTLFAALFTITFVIPLSVKRPVVWIGLAILLLLLVPNSSVISSVRITASNFNLFKRYMGGVVSIWDLILAVLFLIFLIHNRRTGWINPFSYKNRPLLMIFLVWGGASLIGLIHATVFRYGYTSIRSVIQLILPAFYLVVCFILVQQVLRNRRDIEIIIKIIYFCALIAIIEGAILFPLALVGIFPAIKGFQGIPIVLYDQLIFLTLGVNLVFAKWVYRQKVSLIEWVIFVGGIFFLVMSTRRLVWLTLVFNFLVIFFLGSKGKNKLPVLLRTVTIFLVSGIALLLLFNFFIPQFREAFILVIKSFDISSEVGQQFAGSLRIAEIQNIFLNLQNQAPLSYIWGMGLGTLWFEFSPLNLPSDVGTTAYALGVLPTGSLGWWPNFHLPYIADIFRFGFLGTILIFIAGLLWFFRWFHSLDQFTVQFRSVILVIILLALQVLLVTGDSLNSAQPALFGILLALLAVIERANVKDSSILLKN